LKKVATFNHNAAPSKVANIIFINSFELQIISLSIIHDLIVSTTSQPAINAHAASNIAAIIIAAHIVRAFDQTAGHILFATSFAHKFKAMYIANIVAINKYMLLFHHWKK